MFDIETEKKEYFKGEKYQDCLIKKLSEFKVAYSDNNEIIDLSNRMIEALKKLFPQQIMNESHFGHIIGQLNIESGFTLRLKKLKEKALETRLPEDQLNVKRCEERISETKAAVYDYINLCLKNKDYFYSEVSSKEGYFGEKTIHPESEEKIEGLNAKEFVILSRDYFEEKNKK